MLLPLYRFSFLSKQAFPLINNYLFPRMMSLALVEEMEIVKFTTTRILDREVIKHGSFKTWNVNMGQVDQNEGRTWAHKHTNLHYFDTPILDTCDQL